MKAVFFLLVGMFSTFGSFDEPPKIPGAFEHILNINQGKDTYQSPHPVEFKKFFEGDVKLNLKQRRLKDGILDSDDKQKPLIGEAATSNDKILWPNGVVPYEFDCSVANMDRAVRATLEAMAEWEKRSCIRFKKRTTEKNYVWFHRGNGCWSEVGVVYGRKSWLSIGNGCEYKHVMVHELGHALGFWHEQSRPDRDSYLIIHWGNIQRGLESNFKKKKWGKEVKDYGVPYDYGSIMHYPWTAFSSNGRPTLEARRRLRGKVPYVKLSDDDVLQVNRMYKCSGRGKRSTKGKRKTSCKDKAGKKNCLSWKASGFCEKHRGMLYWCPQTCEMCSSDDCIDRKFGVCKQWRSQGLCQSRRREMKKHCAFTCGLCNAKDDKDEKDKNKCTCPTKPPQQTTPTPTKPTQSNKQTTIIPRSTSKPHTSLLSTIIPWHTRPTLLPPRGNTFAVGIRCLDKRSECYRWAKRGDCSKNGYVESNCRISCRTRCDRKEPRPSGRCAKPLGLGWDFKGLPDTAFRASSEYRPGSWIAAARNARLYFEDEHKSKRIGAWCANKRKNQWLKIDLGRRRKLTGIATQGRDGFHEHVKTYRLSFSNNGRDWRQYKENGKVKTFVGNCDHFTPVLNRFKPTVARHIKISVVTAAYPCLRVELYGC